MLPCVCSVIDHRGRQNVVWTSLTHSAAPRGPFFCSYHILTSSVIYYWTDARQHRIYLLWHISITENINHTDTCPPPLYFTGKLLVVENARFGSVNDLHVFPTGGHMKPTRRTTGSDSVGGSGRSSRSSSITSDRSGSLNSIPGSVTSCESRYVPLTTLSCLETKWIGGICSLLWFPMNQTIIPEAYDIIIEANNVLWIMHSFKWW